MSKKTLICTLGGALLLGAMVHLGMSLKQSNSERDLFLANVEALTEVEDPSEWGCESYFDEDCLVLHISANGTNTTDTIPDYRKIPGWL